MDQKNDYGRYNKGFSEDMEIQSRSKMGYEGTGEQGLVLGPASNSLTNSSSKPFAVVSSPYSVWQIVYKGDHGGMPLVVKAKIHHFRESLLRSAGFNLMCIGGRSQRPPWFLKFAIGRLFQKNELSPTTS